MFSRFCHLLPDITSNWLNNSAINIIKDRDGDGDGDGDKSPSPAHILGLIFGVFFVKRLTKTWDALKRH